MTEWYLVWIEGPRGPVRKFAAVGEQEHAKLLKIVRLADAGEIVIAVAHCLALGVAGGHVTVAVGWRCPASFALTGG